MQGQILYINYTKGSQRHQHNLNGFHLGARGISEEFHGHHQCTICLPDICSAQPVSRNSSYLLSVFLFHLSFLNFKREEQCVLFNFIQSIITQDLK